MPIYEYKCLDCGKISEIFLRSSNTETIECPICGSKNLEKLLSASYAIRMDASMPGRTCCGRTERCETPPCSSGG
ncbi:MAG: zinc ribbon domain-containing protein, partial [Dehalococcoidia bacterium]|nr:zinc ribbon domain-containing protein [Dehalococcoidia bacterium]